MLITIIIFSLQNNFINKSVIRFVWVNCTSKKGLFLLISILVSSENCCWVLKQCSSIHTNGSTHQEANSIWNVHTVLYISAELFYGWNLWRKVSGPDTLKVPESIFYYYLFTLNMTELMDNKSHLDSMPYVELVKAPPLLRSTLISLGTLSCGSSGLSGQFLNS